jgi:hypothetical protein
MISIFTEARGGVIKISGGLILLLQPTPGSTTGRIWLNQYKIQTGISVESTQSANIGGQYTGLIYLECALLNKLNND